MCLGLFFSALGKGVGKTTVLATSKFGARLGRVSERWVTVVHAAASIGGTRHNDRPQHESHIQAYDRPTDARPMVRSQPALRAYIWVMLPLGGGAHDV